MMEAITKKALTILHSITAEDLYEPNRYSEDERDIKSGDSWYLRQYITATLCRVDHRDWDDVKEELNKEFDRYNGKEQKNDTV